MVWLYNRVQDYLKKRLSHVTFSFANFRGGNFVVSMSICKHACTNNFYEIWCIQNERGVGSLFNLPPGLKETILMMHWNLHTVFRINTHQNFNNDIPSLSPMSDPYEGHNIVCNTCSSEYLKEAFWSRHFLCISLPHPDLETVLIP